MSAAIKVLAGLAVVALAVPVGVVMHQSFSEIQVTTIAEKDSNSYSGKFGSDFAYHFVSATDENNKSWWDTIAKARWDEDKKPKLTSGSSGPSSTPTTTQSSQFANIEKGFGNDDKSLSYVCKAAYEKSNSDIHPDTSDTTKAQYEKDIWRYCSLEGKLPITLAESKENDESSYKGDAASSGTEKIGKKKNKDLISTKSKENDLFWAAQAQAFFKKENGRGKTASDTTVKFKEKYEGDNKTIEALKSACEEAYKQDYSNDQDAKLKETLTFCSLRGTVS